MENIKFDTEPLNRQLLFKTPGDLDLIGFGQNLAVYYRDQEVVDARLYLTLAYQAFEQVLQGPLFNLVPQALKPAGTGFERLLIGGA